jgi:type VI secretion system protein ImpA
MNNESGVQALLAPLSDARPCGENLESTGLLDGLFAFRVFGETIPPDPPPDWSALDKRAAEALARSYDLRVLAHYAAATVRRRGLEPFFSILGVAAHWLETFWPIVYPLIDEDAMMRRNALNCFADHVGVVDALRRAALVKNPQMGSLSLRDIELPTAQGSLDAEARKSTEARIAATFAASTLEQLTRTLQEVEAAIGAVRRIEVAMVLKAKEGVEASPTLEPLSNVLVRIQRVMRERMAAHPKATQVPIPVLTVPPAGPTPTSEVATMSVTSIRSREDAVRALDAVASFFRHSEPSSPIPLFIERAKRLVAKDFLQVLADVAPDGVSQAKLVSGVRDGD